MQRKLYQFIFFCALSTLLMGLFGVHFWFFDLISHFRIYHLGLFLLLGFWGLALAEKKWAIAGFLLACTIAIPLVKYYAPAPMCSDTSDLKIISINLLSENKNYTALTSLVTKENPDVVLLLELNSPWNKVASAFAEVYPYELKKIREDHFGIGIFSKYPFDVDTILVPDHLGVPALQVSISEGLPHPIAIYGIHTIPPFWPLRFKLRNAYLQTMVDAAQGDNSASIIMGDFNCSSFSSSFREALDGSDMRDTRLGFGWQNSWVSKYPWIRLSIDHAWVSPEICVVDRRMGPDIGSDHLPLIMELDLE